MASDVIVLHAAVDPRTACSGTKTCRPLGSGSITCRPLVGPNESATPPPKSRRTNADSRAGSESGGSSLDEPSNSAILTAATHHLYSKAVGYRFITWSASRNHHEDAPTENWNVPPPDKSRATRSCEDFLTPCKMKTPQSRVSTFT